MKKWTWMAREKEDDWLFEIEKEEDYKKWGLHLYNEDKIKRR